MASVTQRIKQISQPNGGYVPPSKFKVVQQIDERILFDKENVHPSTVGMVVDYMTRFLSGTSPKEAFKISLLGANRAEKVGISDARADAFVLLKHIKGLDDESIQCACELVRYDVWARNPIDAIKSLKSEYEPPNKDTIANIVVMIERSLTFIKEYGPIKEDGFTFEKDGYTSTVDSGDGDFLTKDTLWDFKVSKNPLSTKQSLQLAMYYIMGKHSKKEIFLPITNVGVFNPRLNIIYTLNMNDIEAGIIKDIEDNVICYDK